MSCFLFYQRAKTPSNENKYYTPDVNIKDKSFIVHNNADKANYTTHHQAEIHEFSKKDLNTVDTLKENSNPSDVWIQKYNDTGMRTYRYKIQKGNKVIKDKKPKICQSTNNSTKKSETLSPSVQQAAYQNETDNFNLDYRENAENKPPVRRMLFHNSNT